MTEALFRYHVRVSPKSRSIRLRVTVQHGLEVVVPRGYDEGRIPELLKRKQHWINAALERAESHRKFFEPLPAWRLPSQIKLPAIGAVYHVAVKETDLPFVVVHELSDDRLLITGCVHDEAAGRAGLARWLMRQTRRHLVPRLEYISRETGLRYERVFIKRQRTRWASCSPHKTLSLNSKLLFLPQELVGYVLTHELCHVAEMNHSRRFWSLLSSTVRSSGSWTRFSGTCGRWCPGGCQRRSKSTSPGRSKNASACRRLVWELTGGAEVWNRLGTRLIPKLKAAGRQCAPSRPRIHLDGRDSQQFLGDLRQTLADLGLADALRIEPD